MFTRSVKKRIVIDCDPGTDDPLAILMAVAAHRTIKIEAITTVHGNTTLDNATKNACRLMAFCKQGDIPVYKGCATSLLFEVHVDVDGLRHGGNGFEKVVIPGVDPLNTAKYEKPEHASTALCQLAKKYKGELTVVAIGPFTNIATALMLDNQFGSYLQELIIMGGSYLGLDEKTNHAEFNWRGDPEAVHTVLKSIGRIITVIPKETCAEHSITWKLHEEWSEIPTKAAKLFRDINIGTLATLKRDNAPKFWLYDELAMAVVIDPSIVLETKEAFVSVKLDEADKRGDMIIDWSPDQAPNVKFITNLNQTATEAVVRTGLEYT